MDEIVERKEKEKETPSLIYFLPPSLSSDELVNRRHCLNHDCNRETGSKHLLHLGLLTPTFSSISSDKLSTFSITLSQPLVYSHYTYHTPPSNSMTAAANKIANLVQNQLAYWLFMSSWPHTWHPCT